MQVKSSPDYPQDALPVGTVLGQYTIVSVLGRGAFGITYLAKEAHLDQFVAIKEYLPQGYATRGEDSTVHSVPGKNAEIFHYGRERFLHEAKTLRRFKHPNIVRVLTYFEKYNTAYFVMEYEVGCDLKAYLKDHPQPTEKDLIDLFGPILSGLAEIHRHGYIHRDIKPQNIYIREDGSPVLLDFGTARDVVNVHPEQLTRILTAGFAPYEQENPEWAKQGPWTDIFALATTLYYAIKGDLPIDAQRRSYACLTNQPDPYVSLSGSGLKDYSLKFLKAIDSALAFSPEKRPKSVDSWWDSLISDEEADKTVVKKPQVRWKAAIPEEVVSQRHEPTLHGFKSWFKSTKWIWTLLIIVAIGGVGWLGYFFYPQSVHTENTVQIPPPLELAASAFILAKTSAWHYSRAERVKVLIDQISALPSTSDRTRFLVDQEVKLDEARRGAQSNLSRYIDALKRLKTYDPHQAELAVKSFLDKPEYVEDLTYQMLGEAIREHLDSHSMQKEQVQLDLVRAIEGG